MPKIKLTAHRIVSKKFIEENLDLVHPKSKYIQLLRKSNGYSLFATTAEDEKGAIGLAIADQINTTEAKIVSIKVLPSQRGKSIAFYLLNIIEKLALERGVKWLNIQYQAHKGNSRSMKNLLGRLNWPKLKEEFVLATSDLEHLKQCDWKQKYPLPDHYTIKSWDNNSDLSDTLAEAPAALASSTKSQNIDENISHLLMYKKSVVGWIVVDQVAEHTLRYSSLFVLSKYRNRGQGLHLCGTAIESQLLQGIPYAKAAVAMNNTRTLKLMLTKSVNLIRSTSTCCYSRKCLI